MTTGILTTPPTSGFHTLSLSQELLEALDRAGYQEPTPIQSALIPRVLENLDVIGQAQTGTGKTAAFLLPFMNSLGEELPEFPLGIVLAPTRELVVQVCQEARKLAPNPRFRALPIYGGQRFRQQVAWLRKGAHLIVGTPGRVLDHLGRGTLSLSQIRYVVLDEADRMLDIGFRPDIEKILRRCPDQRQTLLLSATVPPTVMRLAHRYMVDPLHVNLAPPRITVEAIRQHYFTVDEDKKLELLVHLLEREQPRQCIIFCERKKWVEKLYFQLRQYRERVAMIHGDLSQDIRNRIMYGFREGKIIHLVATDVVGRGIDVRGISHIFNYDIPEDPENYVHRIGRTGRIGADGVAFSFITPDQGKQLTQIEAYINRELVEDRLPGFQAYAPRPAKPTQGTEEEPRKTVPIFGRKLKRYSRRL